MIFQCKEIDDFYRAMKIPTQSGDVFECSRDVWDFIVMVKNNMDNLRKEKDELEKKLEVSDMPNWSDPNTWYIVTTKSKKNADGFSQEKVVLSCLKHANDYIRKHELKDAIIIKYKD